MSCNSSSTPWNGFNVAYNLDRCRTVNAIPGRVGHSVSGANLGKRAVNLACWSLFLTHLDFHAPSQYPWVLHQSALSRRSGVARSISGFLAVSCGE